jgi:hypothetical protein
LSRIHCELIELALSLRGRSVGVLEEFHDVDAERLSDTGKHADAETVGAGLIFLKLLMADAYLFGEVLQRETRFLPQLPQLWPTCRSISFGDLDPGTFPVVVFMVISAATWFSNIRIRAGFR